MGSGMRLMGRPDTEHATAAVAVDPRTGDVLAMVSLPSYDANLFVNGISHADYRALMDDPSRPQFNRAVLGGVAPGSTLKPFLALAGLGDTADPEHQHGHVQGQCQQGQEDTRAAHADG